MGPNGAAAPVVAFVMTLTLPAAASSFRMCANADTARKSLIYKAVISGTGFA